LNYYRIHPNSDCDSPRDEEPEEVVLQPPVNRRSSTIRTKQPEEEFKRPPLRKAASVKYGEEQKKEERLAMLNGDKPTPNYMKPIKTGPPANEGKKQSKQPS